MLPVAVLIISATFVLIMRRVCCMTPVIGAFRRRNFHESKFALFARKKASAEQLPVFESLANNLHNNTSANEGQSMFSDVVKILQASMSEGGNGITVTNSARDFQQLDTVKLTNQANQIKKILNVAEYELDILICSSYKMRKLNLECRGVSKDTDVLSIPFNEFSRPGVLKNDDISGGLKHLGDLVLSPAYIVKQCERDRKEFEKKQLEASNGAELVKSSDDTDAGVSKAMSQGYFSLEERLPLFLIHGILHLVGYDHENDKDYLLMTKEEERILRLLEGRAEESELIPKIEGKTKRKTKKSVVEDDKGETRKSKRALKS